MLVDDEYFPARCCYGNRMRIVPWFAAGHWATPRR
jgi:hypothetical protein